MVVKVFDNKELVGKAAAMIFASQVMQKPDSVLGLATGSSPLSTYNYLVNLYEEGLVDFSNSTCFNLDEYLDLAADHLQSFRHFMVENLFSKINIPIEKAHYLDGMAKDPQAACIEYDEKIEESGGIDLQLLGIGNNGHIAFNEPFEAFPKGTHVVELTESTIDANKRFFDSADDVPRRAITMGIGSIMSAEKIVLVGVGENKAQALHDAIQGPIGVHSPASILQLHPNVTFILDKEAASKL